MMTIGSATTNRLTPVPNAADTKRLSSRCHSRIVSYLKLILPALALALFSLILAWPRLVPDDRHFRLGSARIAADEAEALRLDKARIVGIDQEQRPYVITANDATQANGTATDVNLDAPKADITLNNGAWVQLSANSGVYRRDANLLDLSGDVSLFHDGGSEFHTATAHVDLKAGSAVGSDPIAGQGPQGDITGEGFEIVDHGARILFTGRAHAIMRTVEN
jgi:lipopolysaccharide export system protein LptC